MKSEREDKLTNTLVERLQPGLTTYDFLDTECPGFRVRVMPSGTKTYYVRYQTAEGKRRYFRLDKVGAVPVAEARLAARVYLADVVKGHDPMEARQQPKALTLRAFLPVYEQRGGKSRKGAQANAERVKRTFKTLLDKRLVEILPMWVKTWQRAKLEANKAPDTINREVTALRAVLSLAVEEGLLDRHPLRTVKQLVVDTGNRPRYLKPAEVKRLYEALDTREETRRDERDTANKWRRDRHHAELPDLRAIPFTDFLKPLVITALNTGCRRGELFNLQWDDIDFQERTLRVKGEGSKSGKTRYVPLNTTAWHNLKDWRGMTEGNGFVFQSPKTGGRMDNISSSWRKLTKDAKLSNFRFHDNRHHFASMLVQKGCDLNVVRELLGHSDLKLTLKYAYLSPTNTARAVAVLDEPENIVKFATSNKR